MIGGKVTGISSAKISNLKAATAKLRQDAINALIDHYAAPAGLAGDAARSSAEERMQHAWRQATRKSKQADEIEALQADALAWKDDLRRWLQLGS